MKIPFTDISHQDPTSLLGTVVTVITTQANRPFLPGDKDFFQYFVGLLVGANANGIWLQQLGGTGLTWFYANQVIAISQEQVLDPEKEEDLQTIEKIKQEMQTKEQEITKKAAEIQGQRTFNPAAFEELANQIQQ